MGHRHERPALRLLPPILLGVPLLLGAVPYELDSIGEAVSLAYIRATYNVPAHRGRRVEYLAGDGELITGTIVGAHQANLRVRMDGNKHTTVFHPTWALKYLPDGPTFGRDEPQ